MNATLRIALQVPLEAENLDALAGLQRFRAWVELPQNRTHVFAALYRAWAVLDDDRQALELLRALGFRGEVSP